MTNLPHTAVLIFTRTSEEEARAKIFSTTAPQSKNATIARELIRHTVATAEATGLPVYPVFSTEQQGATFGERLAHSVETVFAAGHEKVIIIGNDCPQISTDLLLSAADKLQNENVVCGPATDGGLYLLGLDRAHYDRAGLIALAWEHGNLQTDIAAYAADRNATVENLHTLRDIDNARDFHSFLNVSRSKLRQILTVILHLRKTVFSYIQIFRTGHHYLVARLRAPPASY